MENTPKRIRFAENLKTYRKMLNLNANKLAENLNVAPTTVSMWENGKSYPDLLKFVELCNILSVSPDELIFGRTDEPLESLTDTQRFIIRMLIKEFQG